MNERKPLDKELTEKQKVIRKSYGEQWEDVKYRVNESGWQFVNEYHHNGVDSMYKETHQISAGINNYQIRPKSLQGIEDNNGWFSIKEHGLPKYDGNYKFFDNVSKFEMTIYYTPKEDSVSNKLTHYRPIEQLKPPLY